MPTLRPFDPTRTLRSDSQNNRHLVNPDGTAWCNRRIVGHAREVSDLLVDCGACAARLAAEPPASIDPEDETEACLDCGHPVRWDDEADDYRHVEPGVTCFLIQVPTETTLASAR